jgi:hypothetical protein
LVAKGTPQAHRFPRHPAEMIMDADSSSAGEGRLMFITPAPLAFLALAVPDWAGWPPSSPTWSNRPGAGTLRATGAAVFGSGNLSCGAHA